MMRRMMHMMVPDNAVTNSMISIGIQTGSVERVWKNQKR
jgi:hypothetical protein